MTGKKSESLFSLIPSVDRLLSNPDIQRLLNLYSPIISKTDHYINAGQRALADQK